MAKRHGARQQKKVAKQKARRQEKRSSLMQRTSTDPTVRLRRVDKWPVVEAWAAAEIWQQGIGHLVLARQESGGQLVYAAYMVDVYCLGVKDAFWHSGTAGDLKELIRKLGEVQRMSPIAPACLVKIVQGVVEYALSFGFHPHPDFRHAARLLEGIDPAACPQEFTFGRDGKPFYIRGPYETLEQAQAIARRLVEMGGHYVIGGPDIGSLKFVGIDEDDDDDLDIEEDDDDPPALPAP